jgi:hypothetical protein
MNVGFSMPYTVEKADPESVYFRHINPQWVRLLSLLQMNVSYSHCLGADLAAQPRLFSKLIAIHVGAASPASFVLEGGLTSAGNS